MTTDEHVSQPMQHNSRTDGYRVPCSCGWHGAWWHGQPDKARLSFRRHVLRAVGIDAPLRDQMTAALTRASQDAATALLREIERLETLRGRAALSPDR